MAGELTERCLEEWTDGLSTADAVLSVFSHVRDIPYTAIPGMSDPVAGPDLLLSIGRGSLHAKTYPPWTDARDAGDTSQICILSFLLA